MHCILRGLTKIHSTGIVHRNLSPQNIYSTSNDEHWISGFQFACSIDHNHDDQMESYGGSRWYRSPELLLENDNYGAAVDVWAAGCIMAEMLQRRPLFQGRDAYHQLELILGFTGTPSEDEMRMITNPAAAAYVNKHFRQRRREPAPPPALIQQLEAPTRDLLFKMLTFDPNRRISAEEALRHDWFSEFSDNAEGVLGEESGTGTSESGVFEDVCNSATAEHLKRMLWGEMRAFNPDVGPYRIGINSDDDGY